MKSRPNHHQCKSVKSAVKNSLPSVPPSSFHLPRLTASHLLVHMIQFLHTRIRVSDLDSSINFYSQLGFELGERKTSPQGNQLAFLNLPGNDHFLELTWSADYKVAVPEGPPTIERPAILGILVGSFWSKYSSCEIAANPAASHHCNSHEPNRFGLSCFGISMAPAIASEG